MVGMGVIGSDRVGVRSLEEDEGGCVSGLWRMCRSPLISAWVRLGHGNMFDSNYEMISEAENCICGVVGWLAG